MADKRRRPLSWVLLLLILGTVVAYYAARGEGVPKVGYLLVVLLAGKMALSMLSKPVRVEGHPDVTVSAAVPFYNEDPATLRACLESFVAQTRRPGSLHVVDDGSSSEAAFQTAKGMEQAFALAGIDYTVARFETNRGKRAAMALAFRANPDVDLYVCVDSDTVLATNAVEEIVKPFVDERVTAATGLVTARNHRRNLLTRLIDLRYANAFLFERGAYSSLGSVLCCCGSLAAYRAPVVQKYLPDFLSQTFMGRRVQAGDDRRLTNYCLLEGRVVLQETALADTTVPERVGHYLRQQVRWNKSFFRESLWAIQNMPWGKPALTLSLLELASWLTLTTLLVLALVVKPVETGRIALGAWLFFILASSYARSVRYLDLGIKHVGWAEKIAVYLISPLYGVLHIFLLLPLRVYSLATLSRGGWGTRKQVELSGSERTADDRAGGDAGADDRRRARHRVRGELAMHRMWVVTGAVVGLVTVMVVGTLALGGPRARHDSRADSVPT